MTRRSANGIGVGSVKRLIPLLAWAVLGFVYGTLVSAIPSPHAVGVFWVSNLSAPWLAIAFLAGRGRCTRLSAAVSGAACDVAGICGFYIRFLLPVSAARLGLSSHAPLARVLALDISSWLAFIAPWIAVALVAGSALGVFGFMTRHSSLGLAALAACFLLEPLAWTAFYGQVPRPFGIWVCESGVALAFLLAQLLRARSRGALT